MASVMAAIAVAALLLKAAFTLIPMYWDNKMVGTILDNMYNSPELRVESSPKKLRTLLLDRLQDNDLDIPVDALIIRAQGKGLVLEWEYERRGTWLGSVDLIVRFHQHKDFSQ